MTEKVTREKHPGRVAQGHKLAPLLKKRKEEILHNKEQSTLESSAPSSVQSTEESSVQPSVQSNNTYVYGVSMLAVLAIGACVFLHTIILRLKNSSMIAWQLGMSINNHQNDVICFRKIYTTNE